MFQWFKCEQVSTQRMLGVDGFPPTVAVCPPGREAHRPLGSDQQGNLFLKRVGAAVYLVGRFNGLS